MREIRTKFAYPTVDTWTNCLFRVGNGGRSGKTRIDKKVSSTSDRKKKNAAQSSVLEDDRGAEGARLNS